METINTQTEKQYNEICLWLGNYAENSKGKAENEQGNLAFYINSNSEKVVAYNNFRKFEIDGNNMDEIDFIKTSLEYIMDSERRGNDL
ncbi:MAG: hypothetical protein Q8O84_05100 [Nanoarchaeota archaeon]|nr:hypothetical protein [Nanoarchaeota archaeon]